MSKVLKSRQYMKVGGRLYTLTVTAPSSKPIYMTQQQLDAKRDELIAAGVDESVVDRVLADVKVRRAGGPSIRARRAAAAGGTCPRFGQPKHWKGTEVSTDPDVLAGKCGKNGDGHFATANGYAYHLSILVK